MISYVHAREIEMACHHGNGYHDLTLLLLTTHASQPFPPLPYHLFWSHTLDEHLIHAVSISFEPDC